MNKKFIQAAFLLSFALLFNQAFAQKTETRDVGSFKSIKIGGAYDVFIKKGSAVSVKLEGAEKDLEKIEVEVKDGTLRVQKEKGTKWGWDSRKAVKVYITYTELEALSSSGSSDVIVESKVKADDFSVRCSGSGDIKISLDVNNLKSAVSGSGDIKIDGRANEFSSSVSGSGDVHASNFEAKKASLRIAGSGTMRVHVTEHLEAKISGSGSIRYKGNPRETVKISGSGSVRKD